MAKPSISVPDRMWEEVDERRDSDETSDTFEDRSAYVRGALLARFAAEDAGEWERPEEDELEEVPAGA